MWFLYSSQSVAGMAYMYFTVSKIYCSIKLPKLGLLVILNREIESGVYAKKKSVNRSSNKTVFLIYDLCYT